MNSRSTIREPRRPRTGPAVWAALEVDDRSLFEHEFRAALEEVAETFDVGRLTEVVHRWRPHTVVANSSSPSGRFPQRSAVEADESAIAWPPEGSDRMAAGGQSN
ncbi:DUF6247 family protein [Actinoalloteichus hymeniacidonis]|uniref:Uncharacterized protein n=1 Tax=Actinoalloteichus hymeniacidonis TaxID=340345 RepID=A0AAC9MZG1_9PSEU|nr:DUF6247 family protein [Actinoalloteichus hymeniacidonis]AOS64320.1 hypothetical protein TL08_17600 [Actinoalloteichus hymeniacidonis]MBB5907612.1 hypothetical protein [Actinoalloteichus hymeniacidonis]